MAAHPGRVGAVADTGDRESVLAALAAAVVVVGAVAAELGIAVVGWERRERDLGFVGVVALGESGSLLVQDGLFWLPREVPAEGICLSTLRLWRNEGGDRWPVVGRSPLRESLLTWACPKLHPA